MFSQAAAADTHMAQTAAAFGSLLSSVAQAPRQRYSLAGLGFGLPMSRLYARYFGELMRFVWCCHGMAPKCKIILCHSERMRGGAVGCSATHT